MCLRIRIEVLRKLLEPRGCDKRTIFSVELKKSRFGAGGGEACC